MIAQQNPNPPRPTGGRYSFGIVVAVAVLIFGVQAAYLWDFAIDDVGITYRYALHLATGEGLNWNIGGPRVEGYSNFLWVLILAAARWVGFDIIIASKALGAVFATLNLFLIALISRRIWRDRLFWWIPVILVAANPEWIAWAMSGLEIALYGTFLLLAIAGLTSTGNSRRICLIAGVSGLTLTRPEGVGIAGCLLIVNALAERGRPLGARLKDAASPLAVTIVTFAALVIFRLWYFGYSMPNTVYAKLPGGLPSLVHVLQWLLFAVPFFVAWWVIRRWEIPLRHVMVTGLVLVWVQALVVIPVHPVMYFLHRYQIAFLPLLALVVPGLLQRLIQWRRPAGFAVGALILVWTVQGWPGVQERYETEKYSIARQLCIVDRLSTLPEQPTIALVDAGRIPYWCDLPSIDVWGLCDVETARTGFSVDGTVGRAPEVYILSVNIHARHEAKPHLGMDIMMTQSDEFQDEYALYKICADTANQNAENYDYMIMLNIKWAERVGLGDRITRMNWGY